MPNTKNDHETVQNETTPASIIEAAASTPSQVSKKTGNKNALFHGIYSNEITLPWESPADFENLHSCFKDEWNPTGCSEEQAVFDLAHCTWIKWRAAKLAVLRFQRNPFGKALLKSGKATWADILKHEQEIPKTTETTLTQVNDLLSGMNMMLAAVRKQPYDIKTSDGKIAQMEWASLASRVSETIEINKKAVEIIQQMAALTGGNLAMFHEAYAPETIERDIKVMAAIDARIDKILRRLTSLKEYKRVAASLAPTPQRIASPSVAPDNTSDKFKQN
jgi:hypothetical protein